MLDAWDGASRGAASLGVGRPLAATEINGGGGLCFQQRGEEEEQREWFCNFPNFQGLNCKIKFPIDLGLK